MSDRPPTSDEREALLRRRRRPTSTSPLPSTADELAQAALVADGRRAENELAAMGSASLADLERAGELRARVRRGEIARDALIQTSGHLVDLLADRHASDPEHHDLLVEAGDDALTRAIDRYDPDTGLRFSSFARWWVERAMREMSAPLTPPSPTLTVAPGRSQASPDDAVLRTAIGHLNEEDCKIVQLRLGLDGRRRTVDETATELDVTRGQAHVREQKALAKLRHPSTPGDLTHIRGL